MIEMTKQTTLVKYMEFPRKPENYTGYPGGNIYKKKELPPPNCVLQRISLVNGHRYCGHKSNGGGAYCICDKGNSGSAFECPIGIPRIHPMVGG